VRLLGQCNLPNCNPEEAKPMEDFSDASSPWTLTMLPYNLNYGNCLMILDLITLTIIRDGALSKMVQLEFAFLVQSRKLQNANSERMLRMQTQVLCFNVVTTSIIRSCVLQVELSWHLKCHLYQLLIISTKQVIVTSISS
jgi:hypothetical protein